MPAASPFPTPSRGGIALAARRGGQGAMIAVAALATLLAAASAMMPAHGANASEQATEGTAERGPRLPSPIVERACAGQAWTAETRPCLMAIAGQAGVSLPATMRIIASGEPDSSRPNVF